MNKLVDLTGREFRKIESAKHQSRTIPIWQDQMGLCLSVRQLQNNYQWRFAQRSNNQLRLFCVRAERVLKAVTKHGHSKSRRLRVWSCVIQRCCNPSNKDYPYYGGRGITVCDRWKESFENFITTWVQDLASATLLTGKITAKEGYDPDNCRWVEHSVQMNNTRRNRRFNYKGKLMTASQLSQLPEALTAGLSSKTIYTRITLLGWTVEFSVSKPLC